MTLKCKLCRCRDAESNGGLCPACKKANEVARSRQMAVVTAGRPVALSLADKWPTK